MSFRKTVACVSGMQPFAICKLAPKISSGEGSRPLVAGHSLLSTSTYRHLSGTAFLKFLHSTLFRVSKSMSWSCSNSSPCGSLRISFHICWRSTSRLEPENSPKRVRLSNLASAFSTAAFCTVLSSHPAATEGAGVPLEVRPHVIALVRKAWKSDGSNTVRIATKANTERAAEAFGQPFTGSPRGMSSRTARTHAICE